MNTPKEAYEKLTLRNRCDLVHMLDNLKELDDDDKAYQLANELGLFGIAVGLLADNLAWYIIDHKKCLMEDEHATYHSMWKGDKRLTIVVPKV